MGVVANGKITLYDANDAPVAVLSLDRCGLPADASGVVSDFSAAVTTLSVLRGSTDESSLWTVTVVKSAGVTGTLAGKTFTTTGLSTDAGYVDFTASRPGFANLTKRFDLGKIKQGVQGPQGLQGIQGTQGIPGTSQYFHVRYSAYADGTSFGTTPEAYIGTAVTTSATAPTLKTGYTWSQFKGDQGNQGIPGPAGANGTTYYLHIAYANSTDGVTDFSTTDGTGRIYLGQCVDTNATDPETPASYSWVLVQGPKGDTGVDGPRYLGLREDDTIDASNPNDTYLRFSETPGIANRGVFFWDDGALEYVRTEDPEYISKALPDIISITKILADGQDGRRGVSTWAASTAFTALTIIETSYGFFKCVTGGTTGASEPTWGIGTISDGTAVWICIGQRPYLYGTAEDYGVEVARATLFRTAYVHDLRGKDAWFEGNIHAYDGSFGGTITSDELKTEKEQLATVLSCPTPTHIKGDDAVSAFSALAAGIHTATGTHNGKTVSNLYKLTSTAYSGTYYYADETGYYSLSNGSWARKYRWTSTVEGRVRIYIAASAIYCTTHVQIRVNGTAILTFETASDDYYYRSVVRDLNIGDVVDVYGYREDSSAWVMVSKLDHFRVQPEVDTIGIKNSTDGQVKVYKLGEYYTGQTGSVTVGATTFNTQDATILKYWLGYAFISLFEGQIPKYTEQLVDQSQAFNSSTPESVYYVPNSSLRITFTSGGPAAITITWNEFFSYDGSTSKIKLIAASGLIKFFDDFKFTKETIGATEMLILRNALGNFLMEFDPTLDEDYLVAAAAITSVGTGSGYIRFNNGLQICFFQHSSAYTTGTALGSLYYRSTTVAWTFPVEFYGDNPIIIPSAVIGANWATANAISISTTGCTLRVVGVSSTSSGTPTAIAIGRWK